MISIQGKGVSSGVGVGPLYFYHRTKTEIPRYTVTDPDAEWHRFKGAQTAAIEQLGELAEKARAEAGDEAAMLFETHQMMAEDLDYEEAISDHINNEKMNAEAAISDTAVQFAAMFESMDDSYMQARAADVRDVSDRILGILSGAVQGGIASDVPVLLAADDLAPSETVQLDKSKILGFITAGGSGSSHTAILARTMGIPAIVGVGDALKPEYEGRPCIIDGATGNVVIDPDDMTRDYLLKKAGRAAAPAAPAGDPERPAQCDQGWQEHPHLLQHWLPGRRTCRAGQRWRRHRPVPQRVPVPEQPGLPHRGPAV